MTLSPWGPFTTLPPSWIHVMCAHTFPKPLSVPHHHRHQPSDNLPTNPPPRTPPITAIAIAYFNVIQLLEATQEKQPHWANKIHAQICHFLLPKFLITFTLKTCIWGRCRTQGVSSATAWVKGTAQTHEYAGQDLISERLYLSAAIISANAAFTAKQQLQPMLRCGWTLPFQGQSGRTCKSC